MKFEKGKKKKRIERPQPLRIEEIRIKYHHQTIWKLASLFLFGFWKWSCRLPSNLKSWESDTSVEKLSMNMGQVPPDAAWDDKGNPTKVKSAARGQEEGARNPAKHSFQKLPPLSAPRGAAVTENPETVLAMQAKERGNTKRKVTIKSCSRDIMR